MQKKLKTTQRKISFKQNKNVYGSAALQTLISVYITAMSIYLNPLKPPEKRLFDLRQGQVRTFYNVALSRLITSSFTRFDYQQMPESLMLGSSLYHFNYEHYPEIKNADIDKLLSSYNFNFSGLKTINRQEGIGF